MMRYIIYALILFFVQISFSKADTSYIDSVNNEYVRVINYKNKKDDYSCLAANIYYEAGIEPLDAKIAVAYVTLNRVKSGIYPSNICSVVYQGCQFVWTCHRWNSPPYGEYWEESKRIAHCVMTNVCKNNVADAMYFHDNTVRIAYNNRNIIITHKSKKMVFYKYRV